MKTLNIYFHDTEDTETIDGILDPCSVMIRCNPAKLKHTLVVETPDREGMKLHNFNNVKEFSIYWTWD